MKKLAIIALAALALAPSAANAGLWDNVTCVFFNINCHKVNNDKSNKPWWEGGYYYREVP